MCLRPWLCLLASVSLLLGSSPLTLAAPAKAKAQEEPAVDEEEAEGADAEVDEEEGPAAGGKSSARPTRAPGLTPYMQAVLMGDKAFAKGDKAEAIDAYSEAIEADPDDPLGYCRLGEAQLAAGSLDEAGSTLVAALAKEGAESLHATALFLTAELRERQRKWKAAKSAWKDYAGYLGRAKAPGHDKSQGAALAQERLERLERTAQEEEAYRAVKERAEKRRADLEKTAAENAKKDAQGR